MDDKRDEFLLEMYKQMMNDINRHIMVVWQSIAAIVGAFAIFTLSEKNVIPIDIAASIITLISAWSMAHALDASYWYNRNLVIIANIERQFLRVSDLHDIHYYFGAHRPKNKMIAHLRLQLYLGMGILTIVMLYHFCVRVYPGIGGPLETFEPLRCTPYIVCLVSLAFCAFFYCDKKSAYKEFLRNSPGKPIDTTGISYGAGHAHGASTGG